MAIIDADAHVIETEQTWDFMFCEEEQRFRRRKFWYRKETVFNSGASTIASSPTQTWCSIVPRRFPEHDRCRRPPGAYGRAEDRFQVLYPTLFLRPVTARAEVELALYRGYNRWLAHIWQLGKNRLRWIVLPPLRSMDQAIEEINFAKANGACGVFMRGHEGEWLLSDPCAVSALPRGRTTRPADLRPRRHR